MLLTVWIAVLVFTVPGLLVSWISGLKLPWAAAASIPVSFGIYGMAAWVLGMADMRFDVRSVAISTLLVSVLALVWRLGFATVAVVRRRRSGRREASEEARPWWRAPLDYARQGGLLDPRWLLPAAGVGTGAWLIIDRAVDLLLTTRHGLDDFYQGWDVHWHASTVRFIADTGIASSTRMGELRNIETQQELFYPSAWHAGAFLVSDLADLTPNEATNLTGIVLSGLLIPLAVALIAWRLINNRGLTAQIGAGFAGLAVIGSPVLFWIGNYVGAWPYLAAIGAAGVVLALYMSTPAVPVRMLAAMLAFIGMFQLHPSAVTIVVMALILWWLLYLLWKPSRKAATAAGAALVRLRDVGILAATGIVGVLLVLPQVLSGAEQTEDVMSYSAEVDVTRSESWLKALHMETRHVASFGEIDLTWVLIFAAIGGAVALLWRINLWAPLFYFISLALTVNSLKPFEEPWGDWLGIIGGLHYSTGHRLIMPVALFTFAAAGIGLAAVIRLVCLGPVKQFAAVSGVVSVVMALVIAVPLQSWVRDLVEEGSEFSIVAPHDDRMINDADRAAWDWLIEQPRATELRVMGDPADGHGWMYAYNGLQSVNRHYAWPAAGEGTATAFLYWWPQLLGVGNDGDLTEANDVDQAAEDLNVGFFAASPWPFWAFQDPNFRIYDELWTTPGVTPVYQLDNVTLFAVNQMFTDEELDQMRAPGNSPQPLPPLPTKGELGLAEGTGDWDDTYYHRPTTPQSTDADDGPFAPDPQLSTTEEVMSQNSWTPGAQVSTEG